MKKWIIFSALLFSGMGFISAQDQDRDRMRDQDHLMYQDGVVYQVHDQDRIQLKEQLRLRDGTVVNPDGSYQIRDREQKRLADGSCMDMDGNVFATQAEFQERLRSRNQANLQEHLIYQNGQMFRVKNQVKTPEAGPVKFKNGATVDPAGYYQIRKGDRIRLHDGECLDMDGNRFHNQEQFMERMENRFQQKMDKQERKMEKRQDQGSHR